MFVVFCLLLFAVSLPPPEFPPFVKCCSSLADQEEEKILPHLNLVFKVKRLRLCDKLAAIDTRRKFITVSESFMAAMTVKLLQLKSIPHGSQSLVLNGNDKSRMCKLLTGLEIHSLLHFASSCEVNETAKEEEKLLQQLSGSLVIISLFCLHDCALIGDDLATLLRWKRIELLPERKVFVFSYQVSNSF